MLKELARTYDTAHPLVHSAHHHITMAKLGPSHGQQFPRISISEIDGTATSIRHRQYQFHSLHTSLVKARSSILNALRQDYDYSEWEAAFEYSLALSELRHHYDSIDLESEKAAAKSIEQRKESVHHVSGMGIAYIIPELSKNGFHAVISPLGAAMAAGNCIIVEVSLM